MLYLIDYSKGEPVRGGDRVALKYGWNKSKGTGNWLSCRGSGNKCTTRPCPGYEWDPWDTKNCRGEIFRIFSPERQGSCSSDTRKNCQGKPIQKGDNVFLQYSIKNGHGYWLGEYDGDIRLWTCSGIHINSEDKSNCRTESWDIFAMDASAL